MFYFIYGPKNAKSNLIYNVISAPLKGIPSRVPTGGFLRSPSLISRPSLSRTPAGRKDGGIKLLDINEQPLGYAQAKKRKRMQGKINYSLKNVKMFADLNI